MLKNIVGVSLCGAAFGGAAFGGICCGHLAAKHTINKIDDSTIVRVSATSLACFGGILLGASAGFIFMPIVILTAPITIPIFREYYNGHKDIFDNKE